jgi:hypothetical protein
VPTGIDLDPKFVGKWSAVVVVPQDITWVGNHEPYPVYLTITGGRAGQAVGTVSVPTLCGSSICNAALQASSPSKTYLTLGSTPGCLLFDSIHLTFLLNNRLKGEFLSAGYNYGTSTMTR